MKDQVNIWAKMSKIYNLDHALSQPLLFFKNGAERQKKYVWTPASAGGLVESHPSFVWLVF